MLCLGGNWFGWFSSGGLACATSVPPLVLVLGGDRWWVWVCSLCGLTCEAVCLGLVVRSQVVHTHWFGHTHDKEGGWLWWFPSRGFASGTLVSYAAGPCCSGWYCSCGGLTGGQGWSNQRVRFCEVMATGAVWSLVSMPFSGVPVSCSQ